MEHRIETLEKTVLLGKSLTMSLANDQTIRLWQSFMPHLKSISNKIGTDLISMQVFEQPFNPNAFSPETIFTKWAATPIKPNQNTDDHLETYILKGGKYAVFKHLGPASEFGRSMNYIYAIWFPQSEYVLDQREHFEVLPEGYRPDDPAAHEEIWIPIKEKTN